MNKIRKGQTQDHKLVAAKENDEEEVKYIASRHTVKIADVRKAMKAVGKNGKPARSRWLIYQELRRMGYNITTRYTKK